MPAFIKVKSREGDKFVLDYDLGGLHEREVGDYIAIVRQGGDEREYETYGYPHTSAGEFHLDCSGNNLKPFGVFRYYTCGGKTIIESSPIPFPAPTTQSPTPPAVPAPGALPPRPSGPKPNFGNAPNPGALPPRPSAPKPTFSPAPVAVPQAAPVRSAPSPSSSSSGKKKKFGFGKLGKKLTSGVKIVDNLVNEGLQQLEQSTAPSSGGNNTQTKKETPSRPSGGVLAPHEEGCCNIPGVPYLPEDTDWNATAENTSGGLRVNGIPEFTLNFTTKFDAPSADSKWDEKYLSDVPEYLSVFVRDICIRKMRFDYVEKDTRFKKLKKSGKLRTNSTYMSDYEYYRSAVDDEIKRYKKFSSLKPWNIITFPFYPNPQPNQNTASLEVGMILEFCDPSPCIVEILNIQGDEIHISTLNNNTEFAPTYTHGHYWVKYNHPYIAPLGAATHHEGRVLSKSYVNFCFIPEKYFKLFMPSHGEFDYPNFCRFFNRRPVPRSFFKGRLGFGRNPKTYTSITYSDTIRDYIDFKVPHSFDIRNWSEAGVSYDEWDKLCERDKGLLQAILLSDVPNGDIDAIACGRTYRIYREEVPLPIVVFDKRTW